MEAFKKGRVPPTGRQCRLILTSLSLTGVIYRAFIMSKRCHPLDAPHLSSCYLYSLSNIKLLLFLTPMHDKPNHNHHIDKTISKPTSIHFTSERLDLSPLPEPPRLDTHKWNWEPIASRLTLSYPMVPPPRQNDGSTS